LKPQDLAVPLFNPLEILARAAVHLAIGNTCDTHPS
jgi:hypothetical protein